MYACLCACVVLLMYNTRVAEGMEGQDSRHDTSPCLPTSPLRRKCAEKMDNKTELQNLSACLTEWLLLLILIPSWTSSVTLMLWTVNISHVKQEVAKTSILCSSLKIALALNSVPVLCQAPALHVRGFYTFSVRFPLLLDELHLLMWFLGTLMNLKPCTFS